MTGSKQDRVRGYLELISGGHGIESVFEGARSSAENVLETMAGPIPEPGAAAAVHAALEALDSLALGRDVAPEQLDNIEAIIIPQYRPIYDIVNSFMSRPNGIKVTPGSAMWAKLADDAMLKQRIEASLPAIGRVELPGRVDIPYGGTGFVVGRNLLMTNRHVAAIFALGLGDRRLQFIPGRRAAVDFRHDPNPGAVLVVRAVQMIHPYWDMAILVVEGIPAEIATLLLAVDDARDLVGREIVVIGYPAFDPRNAADVQGDLAGGRFKVKRMQPGILQGAFGTNSFGKIVPAATHDCSTLGGNSGSPIVDVDSGRILGLHFGGRNLERNFAVPSAALAHDSRVVDAGVEFAGTPPGGPNDRGGWWARADATSLPEAAGQSGGGDGGGPAAATACVPPGPRASLATHEVTFELPLRITISLGSGQQPAGVVTEAVLTEAPSEAPGGKVVPRTETDYAGRRGCDADFLAGTTERAAVSVAMPEAADPACPAPLKTGARLDYQNFSIMMHAGRRLALITASNVTKEPKLRQPELGHSYSRKGLFGERWFPDRRLDEKYQLPDVFYSKDAGAFDKGHVVRRDDVAWGETFELLLKGNVDSFHVTNCSPQVAGYNRSDSGDDNWGDLENHILSEAVSERLCVFAGPVMREDDPVFVGRESVGGTIRARIPTAVVARVSEGIAAYGFLLEQDLADVPLEFAVPEAFAVKMRPLDEVETLAQVTLAAPIRAADQYQTTRGLEIAYRAGTH